MLVRNLITVDPSNRCSRTMELTEDPIAIAKSIVAYVHTEHIGYIFFNRCYSMQMAMLRRCYDHMTS